MGMDNNESLYRPTPRELRVGYSEPTDNQEIERGEMLVRTHWRVGRAADPQPEDPVYMDERNAIERAAEMAAAYGFTTPVAVWDEWDKPAHLFILGEQFRRC